MNTPFKSRGKFVHQFKRYYRLHGLYGMFLLSVRRIADKFIWSEYLFRVDLRLSNLNVDLTETLSIESFSCLKDMKGDDLDRLEGLMGLGRSKPFLEHFFAYGARLWIAKESKSIVGLKWSLQGGFSRFYCMPMEKNDVLTLAEQVFHQSKGRGIWGRFNSLVLAQLKKEGFSRVYTGVHCRNTSMLRAVEKAKLQLVGRVFSVKLLGWHVSVWRRRYLWGREKSFVK